MKQSTLLSACVRAGICLVLLLSAHTTYGQTVKTININYSEKDFEYVYDNEGCLTICSQDATFRYGEDSGEPSLPIKMVNVLIAPNQIFTSVSYTGKERIVKTNVRITPNPDIVTTNDTVTLTRHRSRDYKKDIYPVSCTEYMGTGIMDGYRVISFAVCPFRYETRNKTLFFVDNLALNIMLTTSHSSTSYNATGDIMEDVVRGMVVNDSELDELYALQRSQAREKSLRSGNDTIDYLIITNDTLAPAFAPLVRWKKQKGIRTEVKTVENIYSEYTDSTWRNQVKIKHCIEDYKNQKHTRFVLLGGDMEIVPIQKCYSECYSSTHGTCTEMIPADVFYASFDYDFEWNKNKNGIIGEGMHKDSVDLYPDINLTRISVSTIVDVNTFVNKTVTYEKNPPINTWKNRALFGGAMTYSMYTIDNRNMSDSEYEGNMLYTQHFINKWNGTRTRYYDTWSDVAGGAVGVSESGLQNHFANGYSFADISSHGSAGKWWFDSSSNYLKTAADTLHCDQPFVITTMACETNWFDTEYPGSYCLSEAFLRNPNSGVVAYIGSSRYGWGHGLRSTPPSSLGSSAMLNSFFYDSLFSNSAKAKHFGELVLKAKANLGLSADNYVTDRWLHFSVNPMGDCEMPIYTTIPKKMSNVHLSFSNNSLSVNTGMSGCRICIMDLDDNEGYYQIADNTQTASFASLPEHYSLCVTKQDYVPFLKELYRNPDSSGTYYIQDETIEEDRTYNVTSLKIGSDVTTDKPNGAVIIEDGCTTINAAGVVIIKNDFEVKQGAEFCIE